MKPFISEVLSLSIEMQKAQLFEKEKLEESLSKIEVLSNITKNIAAVGNRIYSGEYGEAKTIALELAEYIPAENGFVKLLDFLKKQKYVEAEQTVNSLMVKYEESLMKLEEVDMSKIILAVDDMPEILSFVNNALKTHFKVIAVPSGKAALNVIETQKPDLFILDVDMPEMNGYELAEKIRSKADHTKTPLVFLTGNATRERIAKAMAVGCNDFIVKPVSHEFLLTKAGKFLNAN
jgi:CheY-like chemotaxis protein